MRLVSHRPARSRRHIPLRPLLAALLLLCGVAFGQALLASRVSPFELRVGASGQQPAPGRAEDWPQFRGNPALTGVTRAALRDAPELAWTFEAGEAIESSAAIAGGSVYAGSQSGELLALELATGKLRWRYKAAGPIGESSPAVSAGVVYVGDLEGVVHAVSAADGTPRWTYKTGSEVKASPVVTDGKVLIGSYDEHLYALDARSGKLLWKAKTEGQIHGTAAVAGGLTYIAGCDASFRAIRIADGAEVYAVSAGAYTAASPALESGWAWFGTFDNEVLGLDLEKRSVAWRFQHPTRQFPFYSSPAVAAGRVVLGGRDRMVHALDAPTGKALWSFSTRARVDSSPAIVLPAGGQAGGRVVIGSGDGRLYILSLDTGEKLWEFNAGAPISASPAVAGGYVVIGTGDGRLYAFR